MSKLRIYGRKAAVLGTIAAAGVTGVCASAQAQLTTPTGFGVDAQDAVNAYAPLIGATIAACLGLFVVVRAGRMIWSYLRKSG